MKFLTPFLIFLLSGCQVQVNDGITGDVIIEKIIVQVILETPEEETKND